MYINETFKINLDVRENFEISFYNYGLRNYFFAKYKEKNWQKNN